MLLQKPRKAGLSAMRFWVRDAKVSPFDDAASPCDNAASPWNAQENPCDVKVSLGTAPYLPPTDGTAGGANGSVYGTASWILPPSGASVGFVPDGAPITFGAFLCTLQGAVCCWVLRCVLRSEILPTFARRNLP